MTTARPFFFLVFVPAMAAGVACGPDVQDRPTGRYVGTFRAPPIGGGGGDADGGVGDGGTTTGRDVEGRVVDIADLGQLPDRAVGVPGRQVGGYDPTGTLVTNVSGANGAFLLESLARTDPILLSVSGDPSSFVLLPASEASRAIAPVISLDMLDEIGLTQAIEIGTVAGHVFVWFVDGGGDPVPGLSVEVVSAAPLQGPFYAVGDRSQVVGDGPTGPEGLVVFLNAVVPADEQIVLSVSRALDPTTTMTLNVPIADGVVTFVRSRVDL